MPDRTARPWPAGASLTEVIAGLQGAGVQTARVSHADLYGKCRSKELPVDRLQLAVDGLGFCVISMIEDINGNPLELPSFAGDSEFPDMHSRIELDTGRVLPWEPDVAWFIADLHDDRGLSPRAALRRTLAGLQARGLAATLAPELEFYLLERDEGAVPARDEGAAKRYGGGRGLAYVTGRRADPRGCFKRIRLGLEQLGLGATTAHHEFSPGQFEINLHHGEALDTADRTFVFKEAVRELAAIEGLEANFMAKPFTDAEGSSCHVHLSLARDGVNVFADGNGALSDDCLAFVAGLLAHAGGLTALGAPTVNSYRRLVPGGMAPTNADWGEDHRFTYIRIPPQRGAATRVELRGADSSANPYLMVAGMLAAGLDGIDRGLRPPAPRAAGEDPSGPALPTSLEPALEALEADAVLVDALGSELVRTLVALKRDEAERARRHVGEWDWSEYAFHS